MKEHHSKPNSIKRSKTLNSLKEQLCTLNMLMLLAMQNHDEDAQKDVKEQMTTVQAEIDRMCLGKIYQR